MNQRTYPSQAMGQAPFFYYNPEAADQRHHGHFSPDPSTIAFSNQYQHFKRPQYHQEALLPSHYGPIQGRPHLFPCPAPLMSTPLASPRPLHQKALMFAQSDAHTLSLDTEYTNNEMPIYPATPPLSVSGSSISSSPRTCGELTTPHDMVFFGSERFEGVKEGCEGEVQSEILAGGNWTRCGSPPMTPVYVHPRSASTSTDILSATSCPSLSPSPSPIPQLSSTEVSFCDPRNLFVSSPSLGARIGSLDVPYLPTLFEGQGETKPFAKQDFSTKIQSPIPSAFEQSGTAYFEGLATYDNYSDHESDHDFVKDIAAFSSHNVAEAESKPHGLEMLSFSDEEILSEESFGDYEDGEQFAAPQLLDPLRTNPSDKMSSAISSPVFRAKKRKMTNIISSEGLINGNGNFFGDETTIYADEPQSPEVSRSQQSTLINDNHAGNPSDSNAPASSTSADLNTAAPQPATRRGRKQSLTDDPSKQFVCNVCNRRFRRQEHLKRHVRSLHTQEKPFECADCGKTFSRSDNLAQHARTHGSGAIVMEVMEGGNYQQHDATTPGAPAEPTVLGNFLFEAAQAAITSDSSSALSENGPSNHGSLTPPPSFEAPSPKKRKRSEA